MYKLLNTLAVSALVMALYGAMAMPAVAGGPALSLCVLENNLPYSGRAGQLGFDIELARAVAEVRATGFNARWSANSSRLTEIDDSDFPLARLARGECDAIFSMPGPAADTLRGHAGVSLGAPYYGAAFELMSCKPDSPTQLAALKGQLVAVQSQTVAHFVLLKLGAEPQNHFTPDAALNAVVEGQAPAALLWGPAVGWRLVHGRAAGRQLREPVFKACRLMENKQPLRALRWNLHVATRTQNQSLRTEIDQALATLGKNGRLDQLMQAYGLPQHAPFDSTYSADAVAEIK